jgi:hypothetical protein
MPVAWPLPGRHAAPSNLIGAMVNGLARFECIDKWLGDW